METLSAIGQKIKWNHPDQKPDMPGEYRAALEPRGALESIRRWWTGKSWSNPYHDAWPEATKERCRKELSAFQVFWAKIN